MKSLDQSLLLKYAHFKAHQQHTERIYDFLKCKQSKCLLSLMNQQDTIAVLPTGYGKSLIFEFAPFILNSRAQHLKKSDEYLVIIIDPLNSIIDEQLCRYKDSVHITQNFFDDTGNTDKLIAGEYTYLIAHPEHLLKKAAFNILRRKDLKKKIGALFVDEAHCVVQWGQSFRPAYNDIVKLRAIIPHVPCVALTATATIKMQAEIKQKLLLVNPTIVASSPNRPNIKLIIKRRPAITGGDNSPEESLHQVLNPYIELLRQDPTMFLKTVVYTKLAWCGLGNEAATRPPRNSYRNDLSDLSCHVSQYHAPCTTEVSKN